jgi:cell division protein FtsA
MDNDIILAGLDIGTHKVSVVIGRPNEFGNLEILGLGTAESTGVVRGTITNFEHTVAAIDKAFKQACAMSNTDIRSVNVNISGQFVRSTDQPGTLTRETPQDEITVEDVRRLTDLMYNTVIPQAPKIVHVLPKDYTVDYEHHIMDPVGMTGSRLESQFHIIYAANHAVDAVKRALQKANIVIDQLILSPLASATAVLMEEEKQAGVALIDLGAGTTDVVIYHQGIVRYTAVIPFGGSAITNDINQGCSLLPGQAELLKTKFGYAIAEEAPLTDVVSISGIRNRAAREISVRNLAHIIEARMQEIVEAVHHELLASGYEDRLGAGIVLTGGGASLHGVKSLFELMTGQECRVGHPNEYLARTDIQDSKLPTYATAIGLALLGYLPMDSRERRYRQLASRKDVPIKSEEKSGKKENIFRKFKELFTNDLDQNPQQY